MFVLRVWCKNISEVSSTVTRPVFPLSWKPLGCAVCCGPKTFTVCVSETDYGGVLNGRVDTDIRVAEVD
jgi:hypothetical protein